MWKRDGSLWVHSGPRWAAGRPLAMFDFDSTLHPYRGKGPSADLGRRLLLALGGPARCNVVVFSNRGPAGNINALRRFVGLLEAAGGSCDVYAALARDRCRKPQLGGWEQFLRDRGVVLTPYQRAASFFCGDAAGREGDFAASDRNFATNAGVRFCVPEQIFGAHNVARGVEAGTVLDPPPPLSPRWSIEAELAGGGAARDPLASAAAYDVVVMAGSPASGKSTFARRLPGFSVASQDVQGSKARCKAFLAAEVAAGAKVVVDNTHRSRAARAEYLAAARRARPGVSVAIVWANTPRRVCSHLDGLRCDSDPSGATRLLPRVVLPSFWKNFEPPAADEADELFVLDFAWDADAPAGGKRYA